MCYITITAINGKYWKTQNNANKSEVAENMGQISTSGLFEDEYGDFVYVNPTHIVSIELIED